MALIGGIEAGGTKFVCAVGTGSDNILLEERFPTTTPDETIPRAIDFFQQAQAQFAPSHGELSAIGVGSFGPLDLHLHSSTYGWITSTPKPGWSNCDLLGPLRRAFDIPLAIDTDVNAAAIGEGRHGACRDVENYIYITVGTGVGGGIVINGKPVHGLVHPEMGHVLLSHRQGDNFPGICPYHGNCVEGMCCGPAIAARWGIPAQDLPPEHEAWEVEAYYLAQALMAYILIISPERIILGGGVMQQSALFPPIREKLRELLAGYVNHPAILDCDPSFICPPGLGQMAGITGALAMAEDLRSQQ